MIRCTVAVATLVLAASTAVAAPPPILPFEDVRPGMTGIGRTVFEGEAVVEFDVEILATLADVGPDQDLILARCSGGPLADTRVLSGMSGSPVFVDGKLVGAVAYSWGFATEPIAGITPIEEMLRVSQRIGSPPRARAGSPTPRRAALEPLTEPERLDAFFRDRWTALAASIPEGARTAVPIAVAGLPSPGFARVAPWLRDVGFVPLQGPSGGAADAPPAKLEPGSPVGVQLVRGDIAMTATGTVTWVDGDRVLAFGHPLFGLGDVSLPMTGARVDVLMPSLLQSSRVATPTGEVGALRQDRTAAIAGQIGARPSMIPVRVQYRGGAAAARSYRFDVADDPLLAPLLVYASLNGILANRDRGFGNATVRVAEGSVIKMAEHEDVAVHNLYAGPMALSYATGTTAYILHLLMNNVWSRPGIDGINLILEFEDAPRSARVARVTLDRYRARPGDDVEVTVVLDGYRGEATTVRQVVTIPPDTPAGPLTLLVGGALAVSRPEPGQEPLLPADLDQFVWLVNRLRRNDRVFVVGTREDDGLFLGGARLPNLPPSAASILTRPATRGLVTRVRERGVLETEIPTPFAVEGLARIELRVVAP